MGDAFDWNHMAANLADMVDLLSYWLRSEYDRWIYDPDDPANRRTKAMERRHGKPKPPPVPLIPPVAHRPPSVARVYQEQYEALRATHAATTHPGRVSELVTSDDFDRALGL